MPYSYRKIVELFVEMRKLETCGLWQGVTLGDAHTSNYGYALPLPHSRVSIARFFVTVGWTGTKPDCMRWPELGALQESDQLPGVHGWPHTFLKG
jgi:hypothetical protein